MSSTLKQYFTFLFDVEPQERLKVILLAISFFLVIGGYTVVRELKDSVFLIVVSSSRSWLAWAKIISMFFLVPAIFFHSQLVDSLKKHQLLYFYSIFYGIVGLIFVYFLGHPTIGLANTIASPKRIFGWLFYLFIEGYSPFVVTVFWAYANSITSPNAAKSNYTMMVAGSKLGGITTAFLGCLLLNYTWGSAVTTDIVNHQILLALSSVILLIVPLVIFILTKKVPQRHMHGYEAAYKVEKQHEHAQEKETFFESIFSGLVMFFKYPYVMGIFGLTFFFELISQAFKIENLVFGVGNSSTLSGVTQFLLQQALFVHIAGFFVVVLGTRAFIQFLGEKRSLVLVPTLTGLSVFYFILSKTQFAATVAFVVCRSVNYALAAPLREILYIPTVKVVQFKSKSWIEGFGTKFAKTCAANFNALTDRLSDTSRFTAQSSFFGLTIGFWLITSYLLGKRYEKVVAKNEVIGSDA